MADLATIKILADATGRTSATIKPHLMQAAAEGRIAPRGKLWPREAALQIIADAVDPAMSAGHAAHGRGESTSAATASLALSRAAAEAERARKLRLGNEVAAGNLVLRSDVLAAGTDLAVALRSNLLALPARLAGRIVGLDDIAEVQTAIDAEIRAALQRFADPASFADEILQVAR